MKKEKNKKKQKYNICLNKLTNVSIFLRIYLKWFSETKCEKNFKTI